MAVTNYEIRERILSLPKKQETDVYHMELNRISWFGKEEKLDIRGWSDDHEKMTKGISLTEVTACFSAKVLNQANINHSVLL